MNFWRAFPILIMACVSSSHADYYRWMDDDGTVHYSDQPPPPHVRKVETVKAAGGKPSEAPLPYVLQQAVTNFPVILFSAECGDACQRAGEFLAKRGIPYTELDATTIEVQEELKKLTGGPLEVPVLKVGNDALRGFEEGRWNIALDAAGYPQTPVIPPRPPIRPVKLTPPAAATTPPDAPAASETVPADTPR